ncbi:MAG: ABC transporter substrate-binding protein [Thermoanaerobaculia bacterium]
MARGIRQLVITALALAACAPEPSPLRLGVLVWPPYELAYLAAHRGLIDPRRIELVDYQTPAEIARAFRYGLIDACFLTTQFVLAEQSALARSRIVYVVDRSTGGDALLARPEIGSPADLAGHRIAVEAGPLGGYMLQRALDFGGLTRDDAELVFVDTPDHVAAYRDGIADAVVTYEPHRTRLLQEGAVELFSSRQIPGEIVDVLFVRSQELGSQKAALQELVRGLVRARESFLAAPHPALEAMTAREGLSVEELQRAFEGVELVSLEENRRLLGGAKPGLLPLLERQAEVMGEQDCAMGGNLRRPIARS